MAPLDEKMRRFGWIAWDSSVIFKGEQLMDQRKRMSCFKVEENKKLISIELIKNDTSIKDH